MKYLALLRGINVGGNNIIKKNDLRNLFEDCGFESVKTYIQSGNILFKSEEKNIPNINKKIEAALQKKMGNNIRAVVFSESQYKKAISSAHKSWGKDEQQKHNALFILDGSNSKTLIKELPPINKKVETVSAGTRALFWSASKKNYNQSTYTKELVKNPVYKIVTIRNSNTSLKLLELFEQI